MLIETDRTTTTLNESQQSFDVGQVFEDEGICFKTSYCCTKRSCCNCMVIGEIIFDLFGTLFILAACIYVVMFYKNDDRSEKYETYVNQMIVFAPICLLQPVKFFYGVRWLRAGCVRQQFIHYYRLGITIYSSSIVG